MDNRESGSSESHQTTGPVDIGNQEYLNRRLPELRDNYSYQGLSGLSSELLKQEASKLSEDFRRLERRFPPPEYVGNESEELQRVLEGDEYRGLSSLTSEQKQRIYDCKRECQRDLDRALSEAVKREKEPGLLTRFGAWFNEFVDNLTPLFVIKW